MRRQLLLLGKVVMLLLTTIMIFGCGGAPSPTSPIATPEAAVSVLPTPQAIAVTEGILFHFASGGESPTGGLAVCDPNGGNRRTLTQASPTGGEVVADSNGERVAFFVGDASADSLLVVWDVKSGSTVMSVAANAESSESFFDAPPVRYLAWARDGNSLAYVMHRDLYVAGMASGDARVLVTHREARYNLAGNIKGSVARPVWTTDGNNIVYDAFSPPDVRSGGADSYRDVEYVNISDGTTDVLMENARLLADREAFGDKAVLKHDDGRFFLLDLNTLAIEESPEPPRCNIVRCNSQGGMCASVCSDQGERNVVQFSTPDGGEQLHSVGLTDLGEDPAQCGFQSLLWNPGGDSLLLAVGCENGVGLWSVNTTGWTVARLADWGDIGTLTLLSWLE